MADAFTVDDLRTAAYLVSINKVATTAAAVATACPFCLAMVDLGRKVKEAEETLAVKDVSELVAESLE